MFTVLTPENSARVSMNDNAGVAPPETVITLNDPRAIMYALFAYARKHGLSSARVGYAVKAGE